MSTVTDPRVLCVCGHPWVEHEVYAGCLRSFWVGDVACACMAEPPTDDEQEEQP